MPPLGNVRCQLQSQSPGAGVRSQAPSCAAPTSAERGWEVPGGTVPGADDAGQDRVAFQDVAGETAVPDFVSDVEPCSVEDSL